MPDREKIIKALERCLTLDSACGNCPYYSHEDIQELDCERNLQHDVLALLKEQEAVKPFSDDDGGYWCSSCHEDIVWHQKFCSNCGKPVLWEGR